MPSVAKGQKTISSFFALKPSPAPRPVSSEQPTPRTLNSSPPPTKPQEQEHETDNSKREDLDAGEDEDDVPLPSSRRLKRDFSLVTPAESPAPKRPRTTPSPAREVLQERTTPNYAVTPRLDRQRSGKITDRTSKYLFTNSPNENREPMEEEEDDDEEVQQRKRRLHERFVKKLGRPDSMAEIKRRNHFIEDPTGGDDDLAADEDGQVEEDEPLPKSKKTAASKKSAHKLTPMERQVIDIKRKHMDTVLVVEVGYKFRFFGEDARVAAKELSIVCIPGKFRFDEHPSEAHLDRFASASIPTHRLHVHVKRLVAAGHKVGVVRQLETAALKAAGDNRNTPFVRKLTNLYTKGTYIDDVEGLGVQPDGPGGGAPATGHLLCITETNAKGWGTDEKVHVGLIAVQPGTGDIIYDDFEDGFMRSEIETRLLHIAPCEFLIVGELSKTTEKLVQHLSGTKTNVFGEKARIERVPKGKVAAAEAFNHISSFYKEKLKGQEKLETQISTVLDKVHSLSEHTTICLSAMIKHLTEYGLQHVFDLTKNFQAFSARSHMLLNGNTLSSLEIYRNQTDNTEKGSLFWVLNRTQTRFGERLLRKWVGRPLLDKERLEQRVAAIEELKDTDRSIMVEKLRNLLTKTKSDLEKSLIRIYYGKCSRPELLSVLQTLQQISSEYALVKTPADAGFESTMLNEAIANLPRILEATVGFLDKINAQAAKDDDKYNFFQEEHQTDEIVAHKIGIADVESDLDTHRGTAAEKLKKKKVEYVTVAGIDYLIEVENTSIKHVPASWMKISGTKKVSRFHTPEVVRLIRERDQHKESLAAACDAAFSSLLSDIASLYQSFRDVIQSLATLDCLLSLSEVASRPDYVKPTFTNETKIAVTAARHPMVEQLLLDAYVPNDIDLSSSHRALLITGPNMGGKSSYVRSVALVAIMGQIGSYVPAASAQLGMLDAVFTRMGAADNMLKGESTFMVELSETSDILKQATPRSLVILDELGRGTSTYDGVAIARAVLQHIVNDTRCLLLFITHYQNLAAVAHSLQNDALRNVHMRFTSSHPDSVTSSQDDEEITFLYELGQGTAHRSYGLNVARLANVPRPVIDVARQQSRALEAHMRQSQIASLARLTAKVIRGDENALDALTEGIEQL